MVPAHNEKSKLSVLIIEDEPSIADLIEICLRRIQSPDFDLQSEKVANAEQGLFLIQNKKFDLVLIDWMLPHIQGIDVIRRIHQQKSLSLNPEVIFMLITAKSDTSSVVEGLEAGASDYISKPFDPAILIARAHNLLKRIMSIESYKKGVEQMPFKDEILTLNALTVDFGRVEVTLRSNIVHLTPSEFKLLGYLLKSQGKVLTRDHLIDLIQGEDVSVTGRTIDTHIFALRKKLQDWADHIETIRGVGYRVNYTI